MTFCHLYGGAERRCDEIFRQYDHWQDVRLAADDCTIRTSRHGLDPVAKRSLAQDVIKVNAI